MCVQFAAGAVTDEKEVLSTVRKAGIKVHPGGWCNSGPRGLSVTVNSPTRELAPDRFAVVVALEDYEPIRKEGAHFATLLRRGTYTVEVDKEMMTKILFYEPSCCSERK